MPDWAPVLGPLGALALALIVVGLLLGGRLHSDPEFQSQVKRADKAELRVDELEDLLAKALTTGETLARKDEEQTRRLWDLAGRSLVSDEAASVERSIGGQRASGRGK